MILANTLIRALCVFAIGYALWSIARDLVTLWRNYHGQ